MGVPARIILYATDPDAASAAAARAYDRIGRVEWVLSDYRPESELSRFPQSTAAAPEGWVPVSEDLWAVLTTASSLHQASGGAFDLTVGPATLLWRRARADRRPPDPEALAAARELIDFRAIQMRGPFGGRQACIAHSRASEFRLDAGGIGKGYAAEQAVTELRSLGYPRCLVALAGDIALGDPPPDKPGWDVAISPGGGSSAVTPPVRLASCSISTSGNAEQHLDLIDADGRTQRHSHIIDPRTGVGITSSRTVTVIGPSCAGWVDAVAKVGSIAGCDQLAAILSTQPGAAARCEWTDEAGVLRVKLIGTLDLWPAGIR